MKPAYQYQAKVSKVIDGDTIECVVDLGFNSFIKERFRLFGIDTPEKTDKDPKVKELAIKASEFTRVSVDGKDVIIECVGKDKYGRWLAKVYTSGDVATINEQLVSLGLAKAYFGDNKLNLDWVGTVK